MKSFAAVCAVVVAGVLLAPPQIKSLDFSFDRTTLKFWYPTVVKVNGHFDFTGTVVVADDGTSTDWNYEELRSSRYLCGAAWCQDTPNPIAMRWQAVEQKRRAIAAELQGFQSRVVGARAQLTEEENFLSKNSCALVISGPLKPAFACAPNEIQEIATFMCVAREAGPRLCEKAVKGAAGDDVPGLVKDIMSREGCAALVAELMGDRYDFLSKTEKRYTVDLPITFLSWLIGEFSKDAKEVFDWSVVAARTKMCIPYGARRCAAEYDQWQTVLSNHRQRLSAEIRSCQEAAERADSLRAELQSLSQSIAYATSAISTLNAKKTALESETKAVQFQHALQQL